jgi:rhamnulokinase
MKYHLAVDIGASSGRIVLGYLCPNTAQIETEEIHRFSNGMVEKGNQLCWDLEYIYHEILTGSKKCREINKNPYSIGIDTWGVDFVLLDKNKQILGDAVAYRDNRTVGIRDAVHTIISEEELYERTGIQSQPYNTIYQLMAVKKNQPELLKKAAYFLMVPDYLYFRLCGVLTNEYTNATTTGLVNAFTRTWDTDIIKRLGLPLHLFKDLTPPGTVIGQFSPDCAVVAAATHDTASAVMAAAVDALYISSGTWSLMGIKRKTPDTSTQSRMAGFTNEGAWGGEIRYLKNIMGLWMIQSVKKEFNDVYSYGELNTMAEKADIKSVVDCNDGRFFAPASMIHEIKTACTQSGQPPPQTPGELAKVVYQSLAVCYAKTAKELETLTSRTYDTINIIGGGAKADYLNRLTARYTNKKIIAGPVEATAIGNLTAQIRSVK